MALQRSKLKDLPPDAVVLTEHEALSYQLKILHNWDNLKDIFAYRYGVYMLGFSSFFTGMYINDHYRSKLKLYNFARFSTFLPLCVIPSIFSVVMHGEFILRNLVLQKTSCPVCIETRAALVQAGVSCVFPSILAPVATFSLAQKYGTFNLPDIATEKMKCLRLVQKINKPISNILISILMGQALLAVILTHFEGKSILKVNEKLLKMEEEAENE